MLIGKSSGQGDLGKSENLLAHMYLSSFYPLFEQELMRCPSGSGAKCPN